MPYSPLRTFFFVSILGVISSFFFYPNFELETKIAWATDSIELPPLKTDREKLAFLIWLKKQVPNLFSDMAQYDINPFDLLNDQEQLVGSLKKNPNYEKAFSDRHYLTIQLTPPEEGIRASQIQFKESAVKAWRDELKKEFDQWQKQQDRQGSNSVSSALKASLLAELKNKSPVANQNSVSRRLGVIISNLSKDSRFKGKSEFKEALRIKDLQQKLTAIKTLEQISEEERKSFEEIEKQLTATVKTGNKAKDLFHLYLVTSYLENKGGKFTGNEDDFGQLGPDELLYFTDRADVIAPAAKALGVSQKEQTKLVTGVSFEINRFASQTEGEVVVSKKPVILKEVTPKEGIFRGCTGGDCSSQFSFPFPNDPNERVFFVYDEKNSLKGYVSATRVASNEKDSLYVHTIAGSRISSSDTKMILMGLDEEKSALGVDQILIPQSENIPGFINYVEIRSVFQELAQSKATQPVEYLNGDIRSSIESFPSLHNRAQYDHQSNNKEAVALEIPMSEKRKLETEVSQTVPVALSPELLSFDARDAFQFALHLKITGKEKLSDRVLAIPDVGFTSEELEVGLSILKNKDRLPTEQQLERISSFEKKWNIKSRGSKLEELIRDGLFLSPDAFDETHLNTTLDQIISKFKNEKTDFISQELRNAIFTHALQIFRSSKMSPFVFAIEKKNRRFSADFHRSIDKKELHLTAIKALKNPDPEVRFWGKSHLMSSPIGADELKILIEDLKNEDWETRNLVLEILQALQNKKPIEDSFLIEAVIKTLKDPEPKLRQLAVKVLRHFQSNTPEIREALINILTDSNFDVRISTIAALQRIGKNAPDVQASLVRLLLDPNPIIRRSANDALSSLELDPKVQANLLALLQHEDLEIRKDVARAFSFSRMMNQTSRMSLVETLLKLLSSSDKNTRSGAALALGSFNSYNNPKAHEVHQALSLLLSDEDVTVRISASMALKFQRPTDPKVLAALAQALNDTNPEVKEYAAEAITTDNTPDSSISFALTNALKDENEKVREAAIFSLLAITPKKKEILDVIASVFEDLASGGRSAALKILKRSQAKSPEIKRLLVRTLTDKDEFVRYQASKTLLKLRPDDKETLEQLVSQLSSPSASLALEIIQELYPHFKKLSHQVEIPCGKLEQPLPQEQVQSILKVLKSTSL